MKSRHFVSVAVIALLIGNAVLADSWERPNAKTYVSDDATYRLTVFPSWMKPANYPDRPVCEATLEKLEKNVYRQIWHKPLLNADAPVQVLVAERSGHVVTFDNWGSKGYGDHVVVIYSPGGDVIRKLALSDFLAPEEIEALPRSVSSILWDGEHRFSRDEAYVELAVDAGESWWKGRKFRTIRVRLSDGAVDTAR